MSDREYQTEREDSRLIEECLSGSESAWRELYARFVGLMRNVAKRRGVRTDSDLQDMVQASFMALTTALRNYDPKQPLPRFICLVTERVVVDEYRRGRAAKRSAEVQSSDLRDSDESPTAQVESVAARQDEQVEAAELALQLKDALRGLDPDCRELIELRYLEERSFAEIAATLGSSENTLTVRTRRCLEKLRIVFHNPGRKRKLP